MADFSTFSPRRGHESWQSLTPSPSIVNLSVVDMRKKKNCILPPKHEHNYQGDSEHSYTNTNPNPLPVIAAWLSWPRCWWLSPFIPRLYVREVCSNSCLEGRLMSFNNVYHSIVRQDCNIFDEESKGLLNVKRYLKRIRCVARVTRQEVNLVSGVEVQEEGTSVEWKKQARPSC